MLLLFLLVDSWPRFNPTPKSVVGDQPLQNIVLSVIEGLIQVVRWDPWMSNVIHNCYSEKVDKHSDLAHT